MDPAAAPTSCGYEAGNEPTTTGYRGAGHPDHPHLHTTRLGCGPAGTGTTSHSHDVLNLLTAQSNGGQTVLDGYDMAGHLTPLIYSNGKTVTRGYVAAGSCRCDGRGPGRRWQPGHGNLGRRC